ncbi:TonB family protein [Candidatus Poribacteria bacterium]|nr:TonB family protein [Candidatus Poribacteria bacterium]
MKGINIITSVICLMFLNLYYITADDTHPNIPINANDVKPPRFKNSQKPIYPIAAKRAHKEGKVILLATIDEKGMAKDIKALTQLGFGFEEASIEALQKSTFYPATREGKPVSFLVKIPYEFKLEDILPDMVLIPAGEFQMGSSDGSLDEKPIHAVYLDAYYIDRFEVTNGQYKQFVDANPQWQKDQILSEYHDGYYLADWFGNDFPAGKEEYPVVYVSWYAAMAYAKWAGKRLPTEAEWEKAARGGLVGNKYPWGNTIDATKANYFDGTDKDITQVGTYPANKYGLYDMVGNVREWCLDSYEENYYVNSPPANPIAGVSNLDEVLNNFITLKNNRVLRGGSWLSSAQSSRIAKRNWRKPTDTNPNVGFRCVKSANK